MNLLLAILKGRAERDWFENQNRDSKRRTKPPKIAMPPRSELFRATGRSYDEPVPEPRGRQGQVAMATRPIAISPVLDQIYQLGEKQEWDLAIAAFRQLSRQEQNALVSDALKGLPRSEVIAIHEMVRNDLKRMFLPFPGPQALAYNSEADILGYGGQAGGGKSYLLLGLAAEEHTNALILRRQQTELDGLRSDGEKMLKDHAKWSGKYNRWRFDDKDTEIRLGGCKELESWHDFAGQPRDFLGLDEAAAFLREQVYGLLGWVRSAKPGQRCRVIFATNPPRGSEGEWFIEMFAPWVDTGFPHPAAVGELRWAIRVRGKMEWLSPVFLPDGKPAPVERDGETYTPQSYTFIPAELDDNPALAGTSYRASLQNLEEPLRSQLLKGDFAAGRTDDAWQVIPTAWVDAAMERWTPQKPERTPMTALGVDIAMRGEDNLVLAPVYRTWFDKLTVIAGVDIRNTVDVTAKVFVHMGPAAIAVIDMGGGWGDGVLMFLQQRGASVVGFVAQHASGWTSLGGLPMVNRRAEGWWRLREALDPVNGLGLALPPDQALKQELTAPIWRQTDNLKSAIIVESKEQIKARIGRSTDRADAVIMAFLHADPGLAQAREMFGTPQTHARVGYPEIKPYAQRQTDVPLQRYANRRRR